jgi:hypothetical protein
MENRRLNNDICLQDGMLVHFLATKFAKVQSLTLQKGVEFFSRCKWCWVCWKQAQFLNCTYSTSTLLASVYFSTNIFWSVYIVFDVVANAFVWATNIICVILHLTSNSHMYYVGIQMYSSFATFCNLINSQARFPIKEKKIHSNPCKYQV